MQVGRITVLNGEDQENAFLLKNLSVFEAGRSQGNHILLKDDSVAMSHFRICRQDDGYQIYDLGSRHGTLVNEEAVERVDLTDGDLIQVGEICLKFDLVEEGEAEGDIASSAPKFEESRDSRGGVPEVSSHGLNASLRVIEGEGKGKVYKLVGKTRFSIGRSTKSDLRLKDAKVSRVHCYIERVDGKFVLTDNESANGTIVNGDIVQKVDLQAGDYLRLGFSILKFHLSEGT